MPRFYATANTWERNELRSQNHDPTTCDIPPENQIAGTCFGKFPNRFNELSWLFGLDYRVTSELLTYAKVGRGFKAGGQNENGNASAGTFTPFRPEFAQTYEVGAKSQWFDNRLRVNSAIFVTNYTDVQRTLYVLVPTGGIANTTANAASAKIPGAELEVEARPMHSLELEASMSYLDPHYNSYHDALGHDFSHNRFPGVARWQGSLSATYTYMLPVGDLSTTVDEYYQSSEDFDPDNHSAGSGTTAFQKGFGLLNGQAKLHLNAADLDVSAYVKNALDKRYFAGGIDLTAALGFGYNYYGAPRTYGLRLTKRF